MGQTGSQLEDMVNSSNCKFHFGGNMLYRLLPALQRSRLIKLLTCSFTTVSAEEIQRLYKRFMKLDKDNNGSIDREEFLSIPQIANNPLASRMIAIFDEDGGGDVDFKEFIKGLSAFSAKGNQREKLECKYEQQL